MSNKEKVSDLRQMARDWDEAADDAHLAAFDRLAELRAQKKTTNSTGTIKRATTTGALQMKAGWIDPEN